METEIEVKFPSVDFTALRTMLRELGASRDQPMRLMRRVIIETPELEAKNAFVRIRDEGDKTTLTYKQFEAISLTGAKEIEVTVSDFENTIALLEQVSLIHKSFQESRRETWRLDGVEIVLDEWPWLDPYIEIEGSSEEVVRDMAKRLGFSWEDAIFGSVTELYRLQYPHGNASKLVTVSRLTFDDPLPAVISGETVSASS